MPRRQTNRRKPSRNPSTARAVASRYGIQLRSIGAQVGRIVEAFEPMNPLHAAQLGQVLQRYSEMLEPWAVKVGGRMVAEVNGRDQSAWLSHAEDLGAALKMQIRTTNVGSTMRGLLAEQVAYIRSLPLEAAKRVHDLTVEGLSGSTRAKEIAEQILATGEVTQSRATLIAVTEVARTASKLTQARATQNNWPRYIWRTAGDHDVRKSHAEMAGKVIEWAKPPTLSDGTTTHAGQIYRCRCYPEPIISEE